LYVDDDQDIQMVTKYALEEIGGFEVKVASSGPEAIKYGPAFRPQLVLLDVMMPGMDGTTTLKEMRRMPGFSETPIVFLTAKVQPDEIRKYYELGGLDVITKPYDPMKLSDQIQQIWQKYNEQKK